MTQPIRSLPILATCASLALLAASSPATLVVLDASSTLAVHAEIQGLGGVPTLFQNDNDSDVTFGDGGLSLAANAYVELGLPANSTSIDATGSVSLTLNQTVLNFTHHWIGLTNSGDTSTVYSSTLGFDIQFQASEAGTLNIDYLLNRSGTGSFADGFEYTGVQISVVSPASSFGSGEFGTGNHILADSRSYSLTAGQVITINVDSTPNMAISSGPFGVSKNETLNGTVTMAFTPAPEPGTAALLTLGLGALLARRRRA